MGGPHPPPPAESRRGYAGTATEVPVCLCRLFEAFYSSASQTITKKPFCTSFVGSAEVEIRAAFSRCRCENAEFTRCQSRSEGMLGISVIYTNLHKNEVCKSEKKVSKSLPFFFFVRTENFSSLQFEIIYFLQCEVSAQVLTKDNP